MLKNISNRNLMKIAAYGAVFVIGSGIYMKSLVIQNIKDAEFYKQALKTLRAHPGAIQYLGEPIKEKGFKYSDSTKNNCTETTAQFAVKVAGSKDKGVMYFWANKLEKEWNINRLELELNSRPNERLRVIADTQQMVK